MKRTLLLAATLAVTAFGASAQDGNTRHDAATVFPGTSVFYSSAPVHSGAMKTKKNRLYYTIPTGTYYSAALDVDEATGAVLEQPHSFTTYSDTRLVVPALQPSTFDNRSSDPSSAEWQWNDNSYDKLKEQGCITEKNAMQLTLPNLRSTEQQYATPVLSRDGKSFHFGEKNKNAAYVVISPVMRYLGLNDYSVTHLYAQMSDDVYMFGTGSIKTSPSESHPCEGLMQFFPQPASPLYVDRFNLSCLTHTNFFSADQRLTLTVYNAVKGSGTKYYLGDQVLYTATAGASDIHIDQEDDTKKYASIDFCNRDANQNLQPVVLDQPFYVIITGFSQEGVDVGVRGCDMSQDDAADALESTSVLIQGDNGLEALTNTKYKLGMALTFRGLFDNITVLSEQNSDAAYNVVRVDNSGKNHLTEGKTAAEGLASVPVRTACPWLDAAGGANYRWNADQQNSWVRSVSVDDAQYADSGIYGLKFTCDPLPQGVSSRKAEIWLQGRGAAASVPIILLQGDGGSTAITAPTAVPGGSAAPSRTYNLSGQRVGAGYKGIVVKDGKKMLAE